MRTRRAVPFAVALLALGTAMARAQPRIERVEVYREGSWLACDVDAAGLLDARTVSTVESGLPGSCVFRVTVLGEGDAELAHAAWEVSVRLDLWAQTYLVVDPLGERRWPSLALADSALAHPRGIRLARLQALPTDRALRVAVDTRVEPLGRAERARLARYVTESSAGDADEFALDVGGLLSRFLGHGGSSGAARGPRAESAPFLWPALADRAPVGQRP